MEKRLKLSDKMKTIPLHPAGRSDRERWVIEYLAANLSPEEIETAETSITVQAFGDFFKAFNPSFNRLHFAAAIRAFAERTR